MPLGDFVRYSGAVMVEPVVFRVPLERELARGPDCGGMVGNIYSP